MHPIAAVRPAWLNIATMVGTTGRRHLHLPVSCGIFRGMFDPHRSDEVLVTPARYMICDVNFEMYLRDSGSHDDPTFPIGGIFTLVAY